MVNFYTLKSISRTFIETGQFMYIPLLKCKHSSVEALTLADYAALLNDGFYIGPVINEIGRQGLDYPLPWILGSISLLHLHHTDSGTAGDDCNGTEPVYSLQVH